jgi:nucleoside-diphosphate-sugar epimerase
MTYEQPSPHPIVILGAGYTGRHLFSLLTQSGHSVLATSRNPTVNLEFVPDPLRIRFALEDRAQWSNLPDRAAIIWCFPAQPIELVRQFAEYIGPRVRRLVVLGSTSAYDVADTPTDYPPPWIDETAPIDLTKPRVQGEELLRRDYGAIVLRVAGIYGPGRNPLDWIRTGRVGVSRKFVNLIHVEDVAAICLATLERGAPGEAYNVSDGTPRTWEDICRVVREHWNITARRSDTNDQTGKRLRTNKLCDKIGYRFRHPDFLAALAQLTVPFRQESPSAWPAEKL